MSTRRWNKFAKLSFRGKLALMEAMVLLAMARVAIGLFPFRQIAPRLGRERVESQVELSPSQEARAKEVGWAVSTMSRHTFWESACLVQSIAALVMLRRRDVPSTLYLGVAKDGEMKLMAHAWVRSGRTILTSANEHEQFEVVACFGEP